MNEFFSQDSRNKQSQYNFPMP